MPPLTKDYSLKDLQRDYTEEQLQLDPYYANRYDPNSGYVFSPVTAALRQRQMGRAYDIPLGADITLDDPNNPFSQEYMDKYDNWDYRKEYPVSVVDNDPRFPHTLAGTTSHQQSPYDSALAGRTILGGLYNFGNEFSNLAFRDLPYQVKQQFDTSLPDRGETYDPSTVALPAYLWAALPTYVDDMFVKRNVFKANPLADDLPKLSKDKFASLYFSTDPKADGTGDYGRLLDLYAYYSFGSDLAGETVNKSFPEDSVLGYSDNLPKYPRNLANLVSYAFLNPFGSAEIALTGGKLIGRAIGAVNKYAVSPLANKVLAKTLPHLVRSNNKLFGTALNGIRQAVLSRVPDLSTATEADILAALGDVASDFYSRHPFISSYLFNPRAIPEAKYISGMNSEEIAEAGANSIMPLLKNHDAVKSYILNKVPAAYDAAVGKVMSTWPIFALPLIPTALEPSASPVNLPSKK